MGKWLKTTQTITFEVRDRVATITLNRPEKRNALNALCLQEIRDALLEADDLTSVHCIVLAGAGKDFCAGWDLTSGEASPIAEQAQAEAGAERTYRSQTSTLDDDAWQLERMLELRLVMFDMHKPVIARIHGACIANGTDIALLADLIVVAHTARIGYPPVRAQGSPPSHMWLYHLGPQWAKRMLLTATSCGAGTRPRSGWRWSRSRPRSWRPMWTRWPAASPPPRPICSPATSES